MNDRPSFYPFLVADAGASKTDWALLTEKGPRSFRTKGINPFFHDAENVEKLLLEDLKGLGIEGVRSVHFYGAGCSSEFHKERLRSGLQRIFPGAGIEVEHDLLAAARAVAGKEAAVVAILGTGSNACSYDGEQILEQSGGLGYVLGDEGSGAHIGKLLLRDHLNGDLPRDLEAAFQESHSLTRADIIEAIHRGDGPSRFLAGFARFLKEHEGHPYVRDLVKGAFSEFIERHLIRLPRINEVPFHTVGSVGYHFRGFLVEALEGYGIRAGKSITDVVEGLLEYHRPS